jgi:hypothetical protein
MSSGGDRVPSSNGLPSPVAPARPVFGVPLKEAVAISRIRPGLELPAVVYRCVEYLEAKVSQFLHLHCGPSDRLEVTALSNTDMTTLLRRMPSVRKESSVSVVVPT